MQTLKIKHEDRDFIELKNIGAYTQSFTSAAGEMTFSTFDPKVFQLWCDQLRAANRWFEVV